jgi:hypothetical protein
MGNVVSAPDGGDPFDAIDRMIAEDEHGDWALKSSIIFTCHRCGAEAGLQEVWQFRGGLPERGMNNCLNCGTNDPWGLGP